MRLLLDANVVIWMLTRPDRLRAAVRDTIANPEVEVFVSTASLLEIVAKADTGRLVFNDAMYEALASVSKWLPVDTAHVLRVRKLAPIHRDPFDRIIVAQAMEEGLTLVTGDRLLADYGVPVLLT